MRANTFAVLSLALGACVTAGPRPDDSLGGGAAMASSPRPIFGSSRSGGAGHHDDVRTQLETFRQQVRLDRQEALKGAAMGTAHADAWRDIVEGVEAMLRSPSVATEVTDLRRARQVLEQELQDDAQVYGTIPPDVAEGAQATIARVVQRLGALLAPRVSSKVVLARFAWPIEPVLVTSPFGSRVHPISRTWQFHAGVDLAAAAGQAVTAPWSGRVVFAGVNGGHGKHVELQHDARTSTRFSHLMTVLVEEGDEVKKGEVLGLAGQTGRATGVHLHFELFRDGNPMDPFEVLSDPESGEHPQKHSGPGTTAVPRPKVAPPLEPPGNPAKGPLQGLLELLRRAEADGLRRLELHDLVGLRVADSYGPSATAATRCRSPGS